MAGDPDPARAPSSGASDPRLPGWRIHRHASLPSTNDEARRLAEAGAPTPLAVVARRQTSGRGRHGRTWASPVGGLYVSIVMPEPVRGEAAGLLPLAAGLGVARTVEALMLAPPQPMATAAATLAPLGRTAPALQWPNDVYVGPRKLAGVLCEARLGPGPEAPLAWAVVGVGLNVARLPAWDGPPPAPISLEETTGQRSAPEALLAPLVRAVAAAVAEAERDPAGMRAAWCARAPMLGAGVEVETEPGGRVLRGMARGLAPGGGLVVALDGGGEATLVDPERVRVLAGPGEGAAGPDGRDSAG